ncbi:hypothetical protein ABH935_006728 [Catenulispora sp. GAS73]
MDSASLTPTILRHDAVESWLIKGEYCLWGLILEVIPVTVLSVEP